MDDMIACSANWFVDCFVCKFIFHIFTDICGLVNWLQYYHKSNISPAMADHCFPGILSQAEHWHIDLSIKQAPPTPMSLALENSSTGSVGALCDLQLADCWWLPKLQIAIANCNCIVVFAGVGLAFWHGGLFVWNCQNFILTAGRLSTLP